MNKRELKRDVGDLSSHFHVIQFKMKAILFSRVKSVSVLVRDSFQELGNIKDLLTNKEMLLHYFF